MPLFCVIGFPPPPMMWPGMFPPQAGVPPPQAGAPPPQGAAPPQQAAAPHVPQAPPPQQGTNQPQAQEGDYIFHTPTQVTTTVVNLTLRCCYN